MTRGYSIAELRKELARLVRGAEEGESVQITRRGRPVAVLIGLTRYRQMVSGRGIQQGTEGRANSGRSCPTTGPARRPDPSAYTAGESPIGEIRSRPISTAAGRRRTATCAIA